MSSEENSKISIPSPLEQKNIIKKAFEEQLKKGDTWYLICSKWFGGWKQYVGYDKESDIDNEGISQVKPSEIDNTTFLDDEGNLAFDMVEKKDFEIVPGEAWKYLKNYYGGGPDAPRKVIDRYGILYVELKPLFLKLIESKENKEVKGRWSQTETVKNLLKEGCVLLGIEEKNVRVWDYHREHKVKHLTSMDATLQDEAIYDGQSILFEIHNGEPLDTGNYRSSSSFISNGWSSSFSSSYPYSSTSKPGLVGLINLGNTCFMNSALQCLSHTMCLKDYFCENQYKNELNRDNPLGLGGQLADSYAELLKELWKENSSVAPRDFKYRVSKFAPQFEGYQQHDSQELLAYLLDGLHEDLNRIKKKPYVETKDYDGRPDEEVAQEGWEIHKLRNDSIIVDSFQAQLKSTLQCPKCQRISITFDPFLYLSLPLPSVSSRILQVTMFFQNGERKVECLQVKVPKISNITDLKNEISKMTNVSFESIQIVDSSSGKIFRTYSDFNSLEYIHNDSFTAYEIDTNARMSGKQTIRIYQRDPKTKSIFSDPLILSVPTNISYRDLSEIMFYQLQQFIKNFDEIKNEIESNESNNNKEKERKEKKNDNSSSDDDDDSNDSDGYDPDDPDADHYSHQNFKAPEVKEIKTKYSKYFSLRNQDQSDYSYTKWTQNENPIFLFNSNSVLLVNWTQWAIDNVYQQIQRPEKTTQAKKETQVTLNTCLDLFIQEEILGVKDLWYCNKCKEFVQASKKFDIWNLPNILVIHLKRFYYRSIIRMKLDTLVHFPIQGLDLSPYVRSKPNGFINPIYDLYAVSNHSGGLGGGHYTAYAKHTNQRWYKFDDSHVAEVSNESSIITPNAYLLFYELRRPN